MERVFSKKEDCCGCSACRSICPQNAIRMIQDARGFWYPSVNREKCVDCGLCQKVCSFCKKENKDVQPTVYAAFNKDNRKRQSSSSGGIFIEAAESIIDKGGVVYGAKFDELYNVYHSRETELCGLKALKGSKYVQSNIKNCFRMIQEDLNSDRKVLFVGVPCQVGGLKAYLGRDYDNLYLIDLACHGVASPKVWQSYIRIRGEGREIRSVSFRDKSKGWKKFSLQIIYDTGKYLATQDRDHYMTLFLNNLILRESCFNCPYNSFNREGDITLADFWGIEVYKPHLDDNRGISTVLINTQQGEELFNQIKDNLIFEYSNIKECLQGPFKSCMTRNKKSEKFWELFEMDADRAINKFGRYSFKRVLIIRVIIPVIRKIGLYGIVMGLMGKRG